MGKSSRLNKLLEKYSNLEYHGDQVEWSNRVDKQLTKLPTHICEHFIAWIDKVIKIGIAETRLSPGLHDEPLKGQRFGQRSVRLNKAYRAIYIENESGTIRIVKVLEVNKHEY